MPRYRTDIAVDTKVKEGYSFDPVTEADRAAEVAIRAEIGVHFPDHAIPGEEFGLTGSGRVRWVLDPVDGTRPFICGLPVWGTLIGLTVDGRAELGMMSQPFTRERFWADRDGAWTERDGVRRPLATRDVGSLDRAILHTTSARAFRRRPRARFRTVEGGCSDDPLWRRMLCDGDDRGRPDRPRDRALAPAL